MAVAPSATESEDGEKVISAIDVEAHGCDRTTSNEMSGVTFALAIVSDDYPASLIVMVVAIVTVTVPTLETS